MLRNERRRLWVRACRLEGVGEDWISVDAVEEICRAFSLLKGRLLEGHFKGHDGGLRRHLDQRNDISHRTGEVGGRGCGARVGEIEGPGQRRRSMALRGIGWWIQDTLFDAQCSEW